MNKWKSAARYVETPEGWIIDTGVGYIAIRRADGKSAHFPPHIWALECVREFLKSEEE